MWQPCKMNIVGNVTEQLVDSYAIMHAYKYAMCVYVSLISRPLHACLFSFCAWLNKATCMVYMVTYVCDNHIYCSSVFYSDLHLWPPCFHGLLQ